MMFRHTFFKFRFLNSILVGEDVVMFILCALNQGKALRERENDQESS